MWNRTEENIKKLAPGLKEYVEMLEMKVKAQARELGDARLFLASVVKENGGELRVAYRTMIEMPRNTVIERLDDMENRQSVYVIREGLVSNGKGKYQ